MDCIQNILFFLSYNRIMANESLNKFWELHEKNKLLEDELYSLLPSKVLHRIPRLDNLLKQVSSIKNDLSQNKIHIIPLRTKFYPLQLSYMYNPPLFLYAKGNISLLIEKQFVGIVGSRLPNADSHSHIHKIVAFMKEKNWGVISGCAKGVDSFGHVAAIKNNVSTIGVLGFGHHFVYPKENKALFSYMMEKELLLSEYPPHIPPQKHQFVRRNSIIAGISFSVVIIEAREKSGSLITGYEALEQGKNIYVVPGPFLHPNYEGSHRLIQMGATILTKVEDICNEFQL